MSLRLRKDISVAKVFLSYARADGRPLAQRLATAFTAAGHQPWLDTAEIAGGWDWAAAIERAIDEAHAVVAVLSLASRRSSICRAEQMRALRKGKRVIPALADEAADRPLYLEHLNYRAFWDHDIFDASFTA